MTDFGFISINGRAYISPSVNDNLSGLPGEFVYVYKGDGVTMMRKAGGGPPQDIDGAMGATNSAVAGHIEIGTHVFGCVYETDTGFLTQIGPTNLPAVNAPGGFRVNLSAIPVAGGVAGIVTKRHIVATKAITTYNGDTKGYQFFFIPGGTINDNVTTTLEVNFFDSELISDASHLLDLLTNIPACGGLGSYHNRMLAWDYDPGIHICLVSNPGEPESFDAISGLILIPKEGTGITYCQEYRDVLYVMKFNKMVAFNDNGDVPTSWPSANVDQGLGCGKHGVSIVGIYGGTNVESFITLNDQGIYLFTGTLNSPELTYSIKDFWVTINISDINTGKVSAYTDTLHQMLFITVPQFKMILVGDYANGLSPDKIKWSKWVFSHVPNTIMLWDKPNYLFIGFDNGVHWINPAATSDTYTNTAPTKIPDPTFISAYLPPADDDNINHYAGVRYRINGTGNLLTTLLGQDSVLVTPLANAVLAANPGREPYLLANLLSQKARLQFKTSAINESIRMNRIIMFIKEMYSGYPQ
jgi:hypothetical protein